jgi:putative oxidoreductase
MMTFFATARATLERLPVSVLLLAFRIGVGAVFFRSGLLKIGSWEFAVQLFRDEYDLPLLDPALAATITAVVELGVPPLLFVGLATRLATLPPIGMICVIQLLVYPNAWSDHLLWAAALVFVLSRGPGVFSIDHWIASRWRRSTTELRAT